MTPSPEQLQAAEKWLIGECLPHRHEASLAALLSEREHEAKAEGALLGRGAKELDHLALSSMADMLKSSAARESALVAQCAALREGVDLLLRCSLPNDISGRDMVERARRAFASTADAARAWEEKVRSEAMEQACEIAGGVLRECWSAVSGHYDAEGRDAAQKIVDRIAAAIRARSEAGE